MDLLIQTDIIELQNYWKKTVQNTTETIKETEQHAADLQSKAQSELASIEADMKSIEHQSSNLDKV